MRSLNLFDLPFLAPKGRPDIMAWAARVIANGGAALSAATLAATTTFLDSLETNGLLSKFFILNTFVPDSLIAARTPVIQGAGNALWTNHNFVDADLSVYGLQGDGSTKYLEIGANPSTFLSTTAAPWFGMTGFHSNIARPAGAVIWAPSGVVQTSGVSDWTFRQDTTGVDLVRCAGAAGGTGGFQVASLSDYGYWSINRTDNSHCYLYVASSYIAHALEGSNVISGAQAMLSGNAYAFCENHTTSGPINYSGRCLSLLGFHTPFSAAESALFLGIFDTYRDTLGGGGLSDNMILTDDFESYANGANINGLNGGTGWSSAWIGS